MIEKTPREEENTALILSTVVIPKIECIRYLPIYLFCYIVSVYVLERN